MAVFVTLTLGRENSAAGSVNLTETFWIALESSVAQYKAAFCRAARRLTDRWQASWGEEKRRAVSTRYCKTPHENPFKTLPVV